MQKLKKQNAIVSILGTTSAEAHSAYVLPRLWFLGCLQLHSVFLNFLHELQSISLHLVALFCASYITTQAHTFATLQKKLPLSRITYDILTQAGPENHSKNDAVFLNQALEGTGDGGAGDWPD